MGCPSQVPIKDCTNIITAGLRTCVVRRIGSQLMIVDEHPFRIVGFIKCKGVAPTRIHVGLMRRRRPFCSSESVPRAQCASVSPRRSSNQTSKSPATLPMTSSTSCSGSVHQCNSVPTRRRLQLRPQQIWSRTRRGGRTKYNARRATTAERLQMPAGPDG